MSKNRTYCVFPNCKSRANKTDKLFFTSPEDQRLRMRWLKEMNCEHRFSPNTRFSVCEDHFDLPNDLQNYQRYIYGRKLYSIHKLKDDVVPSKCTKKEKILIPTVDKIKREEMFIDAAPSKFVKDEEILESTDADKMIKREEIMFVDAVPSKFIKDEEISESTDADKIVNDEEIMFIDVGTLRNEKTTSDKSTQCNIVPATRNQVTQCYFFPIKPEVRSKSNQTSAKFSKKNVSLSPVNFDDTPKSDSYKSDVSIWKY